MFTDGNYRQELTPTEERFDTEEIPAEVDVCRECVIGWRPMAQAKNMDGSS